MKTKNSLISRITVGLVGLLIFPLPTFAQNEAATIEEVAPVDPRPAQSDGTSSQLIANYLAATGGQQAHLRLRNVVTEGTIKESTLQRNFRLIETVDGKRHLTYFWTHLARKHRVVYVHDGLQTWMQILEPKRKEAKAYGGADGKHFANNRWLIQPFTLPLSTDFVFKYQGTSKVSGRPAYIVKGYGKKNTHSWFYFDKEKFLLTRWGGAGQIAGTEEYMDYRATAFKAYGGVLMPTKIDLLVENAAFGHLHFEQIKVNQNLSDISFLMPKSMSPTLRQRPVTPN